MLIIVDAKIPKAESAFKPFGEVKVLPTNRMTRENIKSATAVLVRSETRIDASILDETQVRFVGTATIGTDHVDLDYLQEHNIGFASCPGSNANSVAEYVLAALLEIGARLGISLRGKTIGVVGHGNCGSRVSRKAEALGMNVLLNDPPLARASGDLRYLPLDILMDADFISLHVPLTKTGEDATFHLFDDAQLREMKRGSVLINSSRGGVVETEALKRVLDSGHLKACVLDVWEGEPNIDVELLRRAAIGTPHIAGYSYDGKLNATKMLAQALSKHFNIPLPEGNDGGSETPKLLETPSRMDDEAFARFVVTQCYDIERDDKSLRALESFLENERGEHFRRLRAGYPVRREFHRYSVEAKSLTESSKRMLANIGFSLQ